MHIARVGGLEWKGGWCSDFMHEGVHPNPWPPEQHPPLQQSLAASLVEQSHTRTVQDLAPAQAEQIKMREAFLLRFGATYQGLRHRQQIHA